MRFFLSGLLLVGLSQGLLALGTLVQPGGAATALGQDSGAGHQTLLFSPQAVDTVSWLTLPEGTVLTEVEYVWAGGRRRQALPVMAIPGLRFSLQVPARLLSLRLWGRVPDQLTLIRTEDRPDTRSQAWVSLGQGDLRVDLPPWKVAEGFTPFLALSRSGPGDWTVSISGQGQARDFTLDASVKRWDFAPDAWGFTPTRVEVKEPFTGLSGLRIRALGPQANLSADPTTLLSWPRQNWRSPHREWFAWAGTSVLVLVTEDYATQDAYLKRLAFYVEKTGFRGRLWTDDQIRHLHGWNAHDYAAPALARFFTQAAQESFRLNEAELELRDRLVATGILVARGTAAWDAGSGALVSVSHESPPALRAALFVHEGYHGLYFTSQDFQKGARAAWMSLSDEARRLFRGFLAASRYDPEDEDLMINEFQAYLLQRPAPGWVPFLRDRVQGRSRLSEFLGAAQALEALVLRLYGLRSGEISLVRAP